MRAGELLLAKSTLETGTAWDHLNSQLDPAMVIYGEIIAAIDPDLSAKIEYAYLSAELEGDINDCGK